MRIKAIIGWSWAVVLSFIYSLLLAGYYACGFLECHRPAATLKLSAVFAALLIVFIGCCLLVARFCRKRGLDSSGYGRCVLLILLSLPVAWVMTDAKPSENDYSMKDIVSSDPAVLKSYDTLMLLHRGGGIKVGSNTFAASMRYSPPLTCTNTLVYSNEIYRAWDNIAEARAVIEKLDSYPGLADLTPEVHLGTNTPTIDFLMLRMVCQTYAAYAMLKTAEGHSEEAVRQLATLQRVTRKSLPHVTMLVSKMIWGALAQQNIETAHAILSDPHCTPKTVEMLRDAFPPIPWEDVSLRRVYIGKYVGLKTLWEDEVRPGTVINLFVMTEVGKPPKTSSFFLKAASSVVYHLAFRKNRTYRDFRQYLDLLVEGSGRRPPDFSEADAFLETFLRHPDIRNMGGFVLISCAVPSYTRASESVIKTKVFSDLLAIEIADRLGQPIVLEDCYLGGPYGRDKQTGRAFSVGPDKNLNTADDISLEKKFGPPIQ